MALAQTSSAAKISRIDIVHVGPTAVSDDLVRANIRTKPGDLYDPADPFRENPTTADLKKLYGTGLFYDIRVTQERTNDTWVLTYHLQDRPRLTEIRFSGNEKFNDSKLRKQISSKPGEPLDELKLFNDKRTIIETYQKKGFPRTEVNYVVNVDVEAGRGTATFEIKENPKTKIKEIKFEGANAFSQRKLRGVLKTKRQSILWWRGTFKDEQFEDDRDRLEEFYRNDGYLDFEIKDVQFEYPTSKSMKITFKIFEGRQYRLGTVTFNGTTLLPTNAVGPDFKPGPRPKNPAERAAWADAAVLNRDFKMKEGDVFTPANLRRDTDAVISFYDSKGHIDVGLEPGQLRSARIPNIERGTIDLEYTVEEGQQTYVERIDIRGNTKTKDRVIRRELAISPGEVFDMTRVKVSKRRLEGLNFFAKVDARPESTDETLPNRKNLVVSVEEKKTGNLSVGAGFSSIDSLVGFAEVTQANFDLFHPPHFTGAGQKFRLRMQIGTERQDYILQFSEPWFLERKLRLDTELYHRELDFQSVNDIYDETRTGARVGLSRTLGSDFLIGGLNYTFERVGIELNPGYHDDRTITTTLPGGRPITVIDPANVPRAILDEVGHSLLARLGSSIAYDTRNSTFLPDAGQRTELTGEVVSTYLGGDRDFYKLELRSAWYFRGLAKGHVLEVVGRAGVVEAFNNDTVPFYENFYLGGLYSLRGFRYRGVSPREPGFREPIGGGTYWFGSLEYSIPIVQRENYGGVRIAVFYDVGAVMEDAYDFEASNYSDNWGIGLRLNLPIGPLRLDYGFPIHHDEFNSGSGRLQFGVGWERPF